MPAVKPEVLIWARESSGLTIEEAAKKLQLKDSATATAAEKLLAYENGGKLPRSLLLRMSNQYRVPLLAFYLERPPVKGDRGEDFRTLSENHDPTENHLVDVLIRDIRARQSFLRDTMIVEEEARELPFIGNATIDQPVNDVANQLVNALQFNLNEFRAAKTVDEAFKYLRDKAERAGVFVLLAGNLGSYHSNINVNLFRGFVLSDAVAPFVVINDQDSKVAWCFTLLHEITHLFLGQIGTCGGNGEHRAEQFCDDVASEVLLPEQDLAEFRPNKNEFGELEAETEAFADTRNISSTFVSYRLYKTGWLTKKCWDVLATRFEHQWIEAQVVQREKQKEQESGPAYYLMHRNKLGNALLGFAQRMITSGALTPTKAGMLLGVKPLNVHKLLDAGIGE